MLQQVGEAAWNAFQSVNGRVREGSKVAPAWAPGPLPKSYERTLPPLGYPRETDSLCPRCVIDTRKSILSGERDLSELVGGHLGEIRATLHERGKEVWISKTCPDHGSFDDIISMDVDFSRRSSGATPGATSGPSATSWCTGTGRRPSATGGAPCSPWTSPTAAT